MDKETGTRQVVVFPWLHFLFALFVSFLGQFHQHFKSSFCADFLAPKKYKPKM
jgi:hypothetical protein